MPMLHGACIVCGRTSWLNDKNQCHSCALVKGKEVIALNDMRIHIVGDGRAIIVILKGTKGVIDKTWEFNGKKCINILWHLPGFDFIARYSDSWEIEVI